MGSRGNIPKWAYSALCNAFDSYVRIMQVNLCGHENTRRVLSAKVNAAMGVEVCSNKLYYRVVRDTATDIKAAKINNVVLVDSRGDDYQNEHSYDVKCIVCIS